MDKMFEMILATHFDADESAFFARELERVKAQTYDVRYPNLRSRDFIPVDNSVGAGATEVTYRQFDRVGNAKIIAGGIARIAGRNAQLSLLVLLCLIVYSFWKPILEFVKSATTWIMLPFSIHPNPNYKQHCKQCK